MATKFGIQSHIVVPQNAP